jgi:hypothetical protein
MSEQEPTPLGTPHNPRIARQLLILAPFGAVLGYALAWVQGAESWVSLICAVALGGGCLAAAGLYRLRGSAAAGDVQWVRIILAIVAGFGRR